MREFSGVALLPRQVHMGSHCPSPNQRSTHHVDLRDAVQALHLHIHTHRDGWAWGGQDRATLLYSLFFLSPLPSFLLPFLSFSSFFSDKALLCSPGQSQALNPPASVSKVLGLQEYASTSS